ncbi:hypothetical protein A3742_28625 [Oleiphilus sp. HI0071]|nr:hypothetical protein A3742_28625 [Oleiphilus sp. HI0071]
MAVGAVRVNDTNLTDLDEKIKPPVLPLILHLILQRVPQIVPVVIHGPPGERSNHCLFVFNPTGMIRKSDAQTN